MLSTSYAFPVDSSVCSSDSRRRYRRRLHLPGICERYISRTANENRS